MKHFVVRASRRFLFSYQNRKTINKFFAGNLFGGDKATLNNLIELQTLSRVEAYELMKNIGTGAFNEAHIAALLTVLMMRPLTLDELHGFREALLEFCAPEISFLMFDISR